MTGIDLVHVHTLCVYIATRVTFCRYHMMNEREIGTYNHDIVHTTMEIMIESQITEPQLFIPIYSALINAR